MDASESAVTVELRLPRTLDAPGIARRVAEAMRPRLDPEQYEDARMVLSELVSNSVRHAGIDANAQVEARMTLADTVLRMEVADSGPGFRPGDRPPAGPADEQGRGLAIVSALADRWGVADDVTMRVWVELDLKGDGAVPRLAARSDG
jgi:anti-sigma regulatory factor (Ser/Thr protein kinase)